MNRRIVGRADDRITLVDQRAILDRGAALLHGWAARGSVASSARDAALRCRVAANGLRELDLFLTDLISVARQRGGRPSRRLSSAAEAYRRGSRALALDPARYPPLRYARALQNRLAFVPTGTLHDADVAALHRSVIAACALYRQSAGAVAAAAGLSQPQAAESIPSSESLRYSVERPMPRRRATSLIRPR